jgi:hypothetical protein
MNTFEVLLRKRRIEKKEKVRGLHAGACLLVSKIKVNNEAPAGDYSRNLILYFMLQQEQAVFYHRHHSSCKSISEATDLDNY